MTDEKKTVQVRCLVPNGIVLHLQELKAGPLEIMAASSVGEPVTLAYGNNVVDAEFWDAWSKQNPNFGITLQKIGE